MLWRLVPLLALVGLVVNASPVELSHLFSSSVNPCDNFHEFVCNKEGNHGLSPLVKELIESYRTKFGESFVAEKDPIFKEFKKVYETARGAKYDMAYSWTAHNVVLRPKGLVAKGFDDIFNKAIISLPRNKMYTYLLAMKFIVENNLNPQEWKDEHKPVFDEVKAAIVGAVQNSTECPNQKELTEIRNSKMSFGLDSRLEDIVMLKDVITKIQSKFFELKKKENIETNAVPDVVAKTYERLLQAAYDETVIENPAVKAKFYYRGEDQDLFRAFPLGGSVSTYVGETNNPYSGTLLPGALYKPRSPLGAMLKKLFNRYDMTRFLYEWISLKQDENGSCSSVYQEETAETKAIRLLAKSLSKNNQKIGRFTELQWFFVAHRMHSCGFRESAMEDELVELHANPDFQKAFGCKKH
ncbi:hypothetical protein QR680_014543 [Steinernema hermaphroditum]|uniref:Peptidase M13 N-terminal domain-containing protein n=1 Tax=Steinernema hermaphroditum TaxID=289476 RepID=A0AA39M4D1_9BILA|nr:hypothetical protein QR680_014543 [Steinernema hermaphroditum]